MTDALRKALWLAVPEVLLLMALLLFAPFMRAQQNGNLPHIVQSGDSNALFPGSSVTNGDTLTGVVCWESSVSASPLTSCTDANGVVPSFTVGNLVQQTNCISNIFDPVCAMQQFWGKATSTGAVNVSCSPAFPRQVTVAYAELAGNLTFDAQGQTNTGATTNPAVSVTATQQNDIVVSAICPGGAPPDPTNLMQFGQQTGTADLPVLYENWFRTGAAGVKTATYSGGSPAEVLSAIAFKPSSLTIGTTLLPDAGNGAPYSACLQAYGGSGAYTWSITAGSLQSGLSLNSGTGCITGTPTVTADATLTFKATDGTNNATQALPLHVGPAIQTIFLRGKSEFNISPSAASVAGSAGDALLQCYLGEDSHFSTGYLMPSANISDSCGDIYYRAQPIVGAIGGPLQCFSAKALCSGTISPVYNPAGFTGSPLAGLLMDFAGAQPIVDDLVINQSIPAGGTSTTLSSSYVTPVPNGLLLTISAMICRSVGNCAALSTNSPFTLLDSFTGFTGGPNAGLFSVYSQAAPTTGTYSAVSNYSDSNGLVESPLQALVFLRPAAPSSPTFSGEKKRRGMN